jgi:hypothetical protein
MNREGKPMTAEDKMGRAATILLGAVIVAALCFAAAFVWIVWEMVGWL